MGTEKRIVTQDVREIPEHCVPLSSFGGRRNKRGGSWEYETLHTLCKRREIKHWKFERGRTGQLFVEPETAKAMLESLRQHQQPRVQSNTCVTVSDAQFDSAFDCFNAMAGALERMEKQVERLASAVEAIATQPMTPHDRLVGTTDGNGFHN